ncbi:MAG TPA: hypothetical protein QF564_09070 [Pirellulaceae bacterium]|jgi:hypothetical protein|nr:hypothetical protein [Pirellulaceae bacterium]
MDPKDPNFIRDSCLDSTGYRLLTPATIVQLDQLRRTLQIIVASLILGVVCFGGFAIVQSEGPRTFFGPDRMDIMLGLAVICAVASIVAPILVAQTPHGSTPNAQPAMQTMLTGDADHDHAIYEAQRIQVTTIIGCALLEGGAFANLYALFTRNDLVHALVAVILLIGMALRFPTRSKYLRRIDHAVEEARLEQPISK